MLKVSSTVSCVDITHDWIFTGDGSGMVHKFSRSDHHVKASANTHRAEVNSLTVARGLVFTTSNDRTIKISGIQTLELISEFQDFRGLGRVICITVGIEFYFAGGLQGAQRLSHVDRATKATPIKLDTGKLPHISLMTLNSRSLFMASKGEDAKNGELYFVKDALMLEESVLNAKVVFTANEEVRSLALGGKELFVATNTFVYKLDAGNPETGPFFAINVSPLQAVVNSKVGVLQVFGEIAVVGYFPGSSELGIFNTVTGRRVELASDAFTGHESNIHCIAAG